MHISCFDSIFGIDATIRCYCHLQVSKKCLGVDAKFGRLCNVRLLIPCLGIVECCSGDLVKDKQLNISLGKLVRDRQAIQPTDRQTAVNINCIKSIKPRYYIRYC